MSSYLSSLVFFFLLFTLVSSKWELVLEEGYSVTTVVDGHKLKINPHLVIPRPGSSDFVVLDSSASRFYTFSFPLSQESVIKELSGDGNRGFADGEPGSAQFSNPKNFAVDLKGNVYVADRTNHAIRKITNSGVTTIAGGISKLPGHQDGPAQTASFSADFELTFVPGMCALLISDRRSQLVRQINLKAEDCARDSHSVLGAVSAWVLGWVFSCLLCVVIGIVIRPYLIPHEGPSLFHFRMTWGHYLTNLVRQVPTLCFDIRSVIVSSTLYALLRRLFWLSISHPSLMFRINYLESKTLRNDVSLLDCDNVHGLPDYSGNLHGCEVTKSQTYADQLKDLISLDDLSTEDVSKRGDGKQESGDALFDSHGKSNDMIQANMKGFEGAAEDKTPPIVSMLDSRPKLIAGSADGYSGHVDGKLREARMKHPKEITVDDKGNIYVADTMNMAIRKISEGGVTTIAGGKMSRGGGHVDGESEDAKFSNDFDVFHVGSSCSLLVIDRGNRAIREIQLHFDDCAYQYGSGFPLAGFFGYNTIHKEA